MQSHTKLHWPEPLGGKSMKPHIPGLLIVFSSLAASVSPAAAQEVQPSEKTIVVSSGHVLRCRLEKGMRITKAGEPITVRLFEPVSIGTTLPIPQGSKGQDNASSSAPPPLSNH